MSKRLTNKSLSEVVESFPLEARAGVEALRDFPGADHIVVFENRIKTSSEHGKKTALAVGPGCTHKTVKEFRGAWVGDGDTRQVAVAFCVIPK